MNTRDQFGNYLLLKKLSEDALGESFRAGRLGKQGVERVVLLRVFNGQGLDGERLAQRISSRAPLQQALRSPNLGQGVDLGQVRGVPYVAYDYVSGKSLAQLLEQAGKKNSPIPLDHALLIAERIALGLAVAYETRVGDERVLHGFLAPQLVLVSNEGEIRLLGFEASTGLREFAGHPVIKQGAGRYLPPEALAGAPPAKADDVYSLGVVLYELLTGKPVPAMGSFSAIDQAIVAADGGNLHPEVANLLKRSLGPREQRIGDAVTWHKTLAKLMFDGQYNPTTFNLAFFMHNLFREEIERETQEMEIEKTTAIPIPAAAAAPAAAARSTAGAAAAPAPEGAGMKEDTSVFRDRYGMEGKSAAGGKKNLVLLAGIAAVAILGIGGYLLFGRGGGSESPAPTPAAAAPVEAAPEPAVAAQPAGPTPEEIQAQIAKMVSDQSKQLEAGLKAQYDEQMKALQKQLEDAKKTQTQLATAPPPAPRPVETQAAAPAETKPAPTAVEPKPAAPEQKPAETKPAVPEPKVAEAAPVPAAPPTVRVGDLVTMGPGVAPPRMTRRGNFRYPPMAQRMRKEAQVTVKVLIDENGRVVDAQGSGEKAGFGMDEAAIDYARSCTYAAATKNGVPVKMWLDLKVTFSLGG